MEKYRIKSEKRIEVIEAKNVFEAFTIFEDTFIEHAYSGVKINKTEEGKKEKEKWRPLTDEECPF